ncbi:MAG TPA: hypothetical protein DCS80_04935 [Betaproteobacteria bacterium]|nr:hypothetical protein [Betaproteobacteria bacterium]
MGLQKRNSYWDSNHGVSHGLPTPIGAFVAVAVALVCVLALYGVLSGLSVPRGNIQWLSQSKFLHSISE